MGSLPGTSDFERSRNSTQKEKNTSSMESIIPDNVSRWREERDREKGYLTHSTTLNAFEQEGRKLLDP